MFVPLLRRQPDRRYLITDTEDEHPMTDRTASHRATRSSTANSSVRPAGGADEQIETVTAPAKVMRIGSMVKQLLEEVRTGAARRSQPRAARRDLRASIVELAARRCRPTCRTSCATSRCRSRTASSRPTPSCASPRRSWSAGWKACSTASRPRCSPSSSPPASSSSRCASCRPGDGRRPGADQSRPASARHVPRSAWHVPLSRG